MTQQTATERRHRSRNSCAGYQKEFVVIIKVVSKIAHAKSSFGFGRLWRWTIGGRGVRSRRLRSRTSRCSCGSVRCGPWQLKPSAVCHQQLEAIVAVDDCTKRVRLNNKYSNHYGWGLHQTCKAEQQIQQSLGFVSLWLLMIKVFFGDWLYSNWPLIND